MSRSTFLIFTGLLLSGCSLAGDRAQSGSCPAGQVCSSETPNGLHFLGAAFSDSLFGPSDVAPTAAGGVQTVTALTGPDATSPKFTGGFTATSADAAVLAIGVVTPPSFQGRGVSDGSALVQLFQPGSHLLLDQVDLGVETISGAALVPLELTLFFSVNEPKVTSPSWALLAAGGTTPLVTQILGAGGDRLVDETANVTASFGPVSRQAWDLFAVTPPASPGAVSFSVLAGTGTFAATAQVVAAVDDIALLSGVSETTVTTSSSSVVCVVAESGGVPVAGATWSFTTSPGLTVKTDALTPLGCVELEGTVIGPAKLTAAASGFSKSFDLTIKAKKGPLHRGPPSVAPLAGHRAALADAVAPTDDP